MWRLRDWSLEAPPPDKEDPPKKDPPKEDPPKKDPPKKDPPKKDPPKKGANDTSDDRAVAEWAVLGGGRVTIVYGNAPLSRRWAQVD
jgi:hypothetical protein